ncbi:MAG: lipopolysaccharide biosynthesis protein [Ruminococcaceae bacterium]|nr:lipopolysaccharide biosynthesis protein [Oscillospiraceae bacterium]
MINIMFCGNHGVFDGMLTCALSIFHRSELKEAIHFHLLTMDVSHLNPKFTAITKEQVTFFEKVIKKYNAENNVFVYDVSNLYREEFDGCPNESAYCSPYTLIRLLADRIEGLPDKILYLDVDVMFNRDIHLLWDIDVSDVEYAAARDHYGKFLIYPNYINAGVLLWNLKRMRETGIFAKARELLRAKKLTFADQSALIRSTTKKKMLSQRFNDQKFLYKKTVVRHFSKRLFYLPYPHTDNIKQWQVDRIHKVFGYHCFDDIFNEYLTLIQEFKGEQA